MADNQFAQTIEDLFQYLNQVSQIANLPPDISNALTPAYNTAINNIAQLRGMREDVIEYTQDALTNLNFAANPGGRVDPADAIAEVSATTNGIQAEVTAQVTVLSNINDLFNTVAQVNQTEIGNLKASIAAMNAEIAASGSNSAILQQIQSATDLMQSILELPLDNILSNIETIVSAVTGIGNTVNLVVSDIQNIMSVISNASTASSTFQLYVNAAIGDVQTLATDVS